MKPSFKPTWNVDLKNIFKNNQEKIIFYSFERIGGNFAFFTAS
jgi:hypothetical protein